MSANSVFALAGEYGGVVPRGSRVDVAFGENNMKKTTSDQYVIRRYSVRASITLWMVLAGLFWVTLGLAVTYASHWGGDSMEATGHRLSTIAPAAGGADPPKQ